MKPGVEGARLMDPLLDVASHLETLPLGAPQLLLLLSMPVLSSNLLPPSAVALSPVMIGDGALRTTGVVTCRPVCLTDGFLLINMLLPAIFASIGTGAGVGPAPTATLTADRLGA